MLCYARFTNLTYFNFNILPVVTVRISPSLPGSRLRFLIAMQIQHSCMYGHNIARVWINRIRLPVLPAVS